MRTYRADIEEISFLYTYILSLCASLSLSAIYLTLLLLLQLLYPSHIHNFLLLLLFFFLIFPPTNLELSYCLLYSTRKSWKIHIPTLLSSTFLFVFIREYPTNNGEILEITFRETTDDSKLFHTESIQDKDGFSLLFSHPSLTFSHSYKLLVPLQGPFHETLFFCASEAMDELLIHFYFFSNFQ